MIGCENGSDRGWRRPGMLDVPRVSLGRGRRPTAMRIFLALFIAMVLTPAESAQCSARSGPQTVALVELYTSEGCDSCPPADRWLSGLGRRGLAPDRVVPLSLHVDYWDYIGWKDPYAKREFSSRQ